MADTTLLLFKPNYIDCGDLLLVEGVDDPWYEKIASEDLSFGDLLQVVSYKELLSLSTELGTTQDRPDKNTILRKVQYAEGMVDSYVSAHYEVPLILSSGNVPSSLVNASLQIFRYALYERRPNIPQNVVDSYDRVMAWLMDVQRNRASVPEFILDGTGAIETKYSTVNTVVGSVDRSGLVFNESNL